ncbi:MAG: serine/threonine-protein kinase [Vicinamibacterales bacterium]
MISEPALDRLSAMFQGPDVTGTRYELISVLGRGGMGVVYLARDTVLDREVALKIVERPSDNANEARILARLEHPGIVPVHDFGELADGRLYYAMKRVRGDRLDRWMVSGCDLAERLGVFVRVCEAVAFAHAHGVVHRDLKPENVMVGEFGEVLVLDWGIAGELQIAECRLQIDKCRLQIDERGEESAGVRVQSAERGVQIAGTVDYMAPEQMRGDVIDHRADVFALGAILARIADVPPVLAIARKARADDPGARYQDVEALAADVGRFLAGRAVEAHRERLIDRLTRVGRRHRVPILLVLTYLVVRLFFLWLMRS